MITFTDDQLNEVVSGAILQMLTPEVREQLISDAVAKLLEPVKEKNYPYSSKTPMQQAFENAAANVAREVFSEELRRPEYRAKIAELAGKAINAMAESDEVGSAFAGAFTNMLAKAAEKGW